MTGGSGIVKEQPSDRPHAREKMARVLGIPEDLGARRDGTLPAVRVDALADAGPYAAMSPVV